MHRIDNATAVAVLPTFAGAGTAGYWTGGNPGAGQPATILDQDWFNAVQEELVNVITGPGLTLTKGTNTQVRDGVKLLAATLATVAVTGGPTTFTATPSPAFASLTDGIRLLAVFAATNSGTATLNINGLGAKTIFQADGATPVAASGLPLNAHLVYRTGINSGAGGWVLLTPIQASVTGASTGSAGVVQLATGAETAALTVTNKAVTPAGLASALPVAATTSTAGLVILANTAQAQAGTDTAKAMTPADVAAVVQSGTQLSAVDTSGAANTITASLTPDPGAPTAGMSARIRVANTVTGATTLNLNGHGAVSVKVAGADPVAGQLVGGQYYSFVYDTTTGTWQLTSPPATTPGAAVAVCNFAGRGTNGACTLNKATNIASVQRTAAGTYAVTFTNNMADINYAVVFGLQSTAGNPNTSITMLNGTKTISGFQVFMQTGNANQTSGPQDCTEVYFAVYD